MSVRVKVGPLTEADAIGIWDATHDVHLCLIHDVLNPGQQLVAGAYLARQLRHLAPDAGVHLAAGQLTAISPSIASRELTDLMDQRQLTTEGVAEVLTLLCDAEPTLLEEARTAWPTSRPGH